MRSALFILLLWSSACCAQGLDRKPTVRSEIGRGNDAGFYCQLKNIGKFPETSDCVLATVNENREQHKANDAFKLGMYSTVLFHWESTRGGSLEDEHISSGLKSWREELKRSRAILKVSDKDICAAMELDKCDALYKSLAVK
jgi:hypothetical protein